MKMYMIPGLGFDSRIFQNLSVEGIEPIYLEWLDPHQNESLESYTLRMAESINQREKFALLGHSFGGVICQEMARQFQPDKIILVSSITQRKEIPLNLKMLDVLKLYQVINKRTILSTFPFWGHSYGYDKKEHKILFKSMINNISDYYLNWAIQKLSSWDNQSLGSGIEMIRLHGSHDKTLPIRLSSGIDHVIDQGDHFMVYKRAEEINAILANSFFGKNEQ